MNREKPRIIVTTDGETDDQCSMVRFLLYANEWDIEGIIPSSSRFHWVGHRWAGTDWILRDIDLYAQVYDNLRQHADGYPTPQTLKQRVYIGNIETMGGMEHDTPGSDRIVDVLLDSDPRPVYLQAWGGTNTIARALQRIELDYPDQMPRIARKAVLYIILDQDKTFREYIRPHWPQLMVLASYQQFDTIAYKWRQFIPESLHELFEAPWMREHILEGHGPLCSRYRTSNGAFISEGDSPAFMYTLDVGLRTLEHPSYGGWGGRFIRQTGIDNVWRDARDDDDIGKPIWRWARAFQNDWAARADWCVKPFTQANHPPVVVIDGPLDRVVNRRQKVQLSAAASTDPDGDDLTYNWWSYTDAATYPRSIEIKDATKPTVTLTVPHWNIRTGDTIHVICEVTDDGDPPLTRYARIILTIRSDGK